LSSMTVMPLMVSISCSICAIFRILLELSRIGLVGDL
jgi:hypothetical protein